MPNTLHDNTLDFLLSYRDNHPSFVFSLREKNNNNRLQDGLWFQGNQDYAFVGLYNRSGGSNMTKSIGLVFWLDEAGNIESHLELVFNEEIDQSILVFYNRVINNLGGFAEVHRTKFKKNLIGNGGHNKAFGFLEHDKPRIDETLRNMNLESLLISEEKFNRNLQRVLDIRAGHISTVKNTKRMKMAYNTILFGPPGTGKTYHTKSLAVQITDPDFYELNKDDRNEIRERFNSLLIKDWDTPQKGHNGRISFCTFHQSFSYEDFIEGIKPVKPAEGDTFLKYEVQDGIFKRIADRASYFSSGSARRDKASITLSEEQYQRATFYKISLGDINRPEDQAIYDYCIENSCITIGFMEGVDLTGKSEQDLYAISDNNNLSRFSAQAMSYFSLYLKAGNYVLVSKGNYKVRGIGKVTGDYIYDEHAPIPYYHFRKVEWIIKDTEIPVEEVYEKAFSQQTIYKLNSNWIKKEFFVSSASSQIDRDNVPNFVLVIDEINRGNVSQIFGELITLIEEDKRTSKDEELVVTLPYSKENFSVPPNLYILGTMNTADRSVEALDTALRRRFSFIEMLPEPSILSQFGELSDTMGKLEEVDIDLVEVLKTINYRIEKLLDKDHLIGHAYFMKVDSVQKLKSIFHDSIVPLLQEYFFGDYSKIGLILGKDFFQEVLTDQHPSTTFADFYHEAIDDLNSRTVVRLKDISRMNGDEFIAAINRLLRK